MEQQVTIRYTVPSKYDVAPIGSICKVMNDGDDYNIYIQTSNDEDHMVWEKTGDFLEEVFSKYLQEPKFIQTCLDLLCSSEEKKDHCIDRLIDSVDTY